MSIDTSGDFMAVEDEFIWRKEVIAEEAFDAFCSGAVVS
jgi:hypothetical protein